MSDRVFTGVELVFYPEYRNDRLRFGKPVGRLNLDKRRALALFEPGQVFGYLRWSANEFGTQIWCLLIAQSVGKGERVVRLEGVKPGASVLLQLNGAARVRQMLKRLDVLETEGFTLQDISPSYFRHLHNRCLTRSKIRPYSIFQQRAVKAAGRVRQ